MMNIVKVDVTLPLKRSQFDKTISVSTSRLSMACGAEYDIIDVNLDQLISWNNGDTDELSLTVLRDISFVEFDFSGSGSISVDDSLSKSINLVNLTNVYLRGPLSSQYRLSDDNADAVNYITNKLSSL